VVQGDRLTGFVDVRDVRRVPRREWPTKSVGEIAVDPALGPRARLDDSAFDALQELIRLDAEAIVVMDGDRLVGLLHRQDILRWLSFRADDQAGSGAGKWAGSRA
jgi:CBS domain-containing protein